MSRDYDRVEVTVDKATWFPVRYTASLHGKINYESRLTDVQLDVPVVRTGSSSRRSPAALALGRSRRRGLPRWAGIEEVAHAFSYHPLAPASLPARLQLLTGQPVAPKSVFELWVGYATTRENRRLVVTHDVTALYYRTGFRSFTVTTRREEPARSPPPLWPTHSSPGWARPVPPPARAAKRGRCRNGALAGESARLSMPATGLPHLWAFHDGLMVTIGCDLTERQLIAVAESLEPLRQQ